MIHDRELLERLERDLLKNDMSTPGENLHLLDAMWEEAVYLSVLPIPNPLEGIETDLRIAKAVNSV